MPSGKQRKGQSGEDSEDESEVLEESPCGRWLKRREEVRLNFSYDIFCHSCVRLISFDFHLSLMKVLMRTSIQAL